jgi:tRNA(fMet)-specific endonuclease VapC
VGILIDSNVFIGIERAELDIDSATVGLRAEDDCLISVVTASELLHGVHRAKAPRARARRAAFVEQVLSQFGILPVDLAIARVHSRIWADLESRGQMIGTHDLWLAATAIAYGHTLATANVGEFSRVPGLRVKLWPPR